MSVFSNLQMRKGIAAKTLEELKQKIKDKFKEEVRELLYEVRTTVQL